MMGTDVVALIQTLAPSDGPLGPKVSGFAQTLSELGPLEIGPEVSEFASNLVPTPGPPDIPTLVGDIVLDLLGIGSPDI